MNGHGSPSVAYATGGNYDGSLRDKTASLFSISVLPSPRLHPPLPLAGQSGPDAPQPAASARVGDGETVGERDGEPVECFLSLEQTLQLSNQIQQVSWALGEVGVL